MKIVNNSIEDPNDKQFATSAKYKSNSSNPGKTGSDYGFSTVHIWKFWGIIIDENKLKEKILKIAAIYKEESTKK